MAEYKNYEPDRTGNILTVLYITLFIASGVAVLGAFTMWFLAAAFWSQQFTALGFIAAALSIVLVSIGGGITTLVPDETQK